MSRAMLRTIRSCGLSCWPKSGRRSLFDLATAQSRWGGRLRLSEEVEDALTSQRPIMALETAIVTHGMPFPTNLTTAESLETILRDHTVTPATIALIDGNVHVGLAAEQLARLADPEAKDKAKVSRRDLAPALARKLMGGTTVAGTMYIAHSVGIEMFVTGGIGGVHRGAEQTFDVSADLIELGKTPVAVVCAGAKSILDIPKTLEVLETNGVCVATYGRSNDFPAFYSPTSALKSPWAVDTPHSAAKMIDIGLSAPQPLSTLLAVPIPEEHGQAGGRVQGFVEQAIQESYAQNILGRDVTPWVLKRVGELSGGESLDLNIKLIENNARVGAQVAIELNKLQRERFGNGSSTSFQPASTPLLRQSNAGSSRGVNTAASDQPRPLVAVVGSIALDLTSSASVPISPRSTTPGKIVFTPGGVGRNIAEAAQHILEPNSVQLISCLGSSSDGELDSAGKVLMDEMAQTRMRTDGLMTVPKQKSATCSLVLEQGGDLVAGVADMEIVENLDTAMVVNSLERSTPRMIVFDCNPSAEVISDVIKFALSSRTPTFCDPTSVPKMARLIPALRAHLPHDMTAPRPLSHLSPNVLELDQLYASLIEEDDTSSPAWTYINSFGLDATWRNKVEAFTSATELQWLRTEGVIQKMIFLLAYAGSFWLKAGKRGLVHLSMTPKPPRAPTSISFALNRPFHGYLALTLYSAIDIPSGEIVNTTGAGDTLVGGLVAGLVSGQGSEQEWVLRALQGVERTLRSHRAVGKVDQEAITL